MKHIYTFLALGALSALSLGAQSKIDLEGRMLLNRINGKSPVNTELKAELTPKSKKTKSVEVQKITRLSSIVVINKGYTAADIEAAGFEVTKDLNSVALVNVPSTDVERLAELDCVRQISFGRTLQHCMDKARLFAGVDDIHAGFEHNGTTHSFTGKGVCTGIYDTGVEANHVNFLNADGSTRVKQLTEYYEDENGDLYRSIYNDPTTFTTDDEEETHGTHTTGIMAGGYLDDTHYIYVYPTADDWSAWGGGFADDANPYYGVAPESDLLISAGVLEDASSIDGFERMASYAKENGQPCVINYSIGSILGPHDGTDAFSQAVSEIVDEYGAIICMAAGNDGGTKSTLKKTFTADDNVLKTCVTPNSAYSTSQVQAIVDFWADDDTPFTFKVNSFKPKLILGSDKDENVVTVDQPDTAVDLYYQNVSGATYSSVLYDHYNGAEVLVLSEVDPNNNRYHVMALIVTRRKTNYASYIYLQVEAQPGKTVTAQLAQAGEFTAQSKTAGSVDGDDTNTIGDGCCNPDVISVGAYNSRPYYGKLSGNVRYMTPGLYEEGGYALFSSYGTTPDGRQLPEVLGPGYNMVSSYSSYYVAQGNSGETSTDMSAQATVNGKTHYWGEMSGTSMACPFVAGTIALWLEADPNLTVDEVHQLIAKTSTNDELLQDSEGKTGYGRINPVGGLKEILNSQLSGLTTVDADNLDTNLIIDQQQGSLSVFVAGETSLTASLYTAAGLKAAQSKASGSEATLNTSSLTPGIYILSVETASGNTATRKVAIR